MGAGDVRTGVLQGHRGSAPGWFVLWTAWWPAVHEQYTFNFNNVRN